MSTIKSALFFLSLIPLCSAAAAETPPTLRDTVKQAIAGNPEVQARWHALLAAGHERDVARGSFLPSLDLRAGAGRENLEQPGARTELNRRGVALTLNQMLYDGFSTREEVARLAYARLTRYYELLDATESTALETTRAYLDVLRFRELMRQAEDNLARHEEVFTQIQERVQAGVGRRVDLEQAGGRLALAQSNLLTEASNLHDVSARFQRVVGKLPADAMTAPALLDQAIPPEMTAALERAYQNNPAFNAAIENVRVAQAEARGRQSNFQPRVDLRASKSRDYNVNSIAGTRDDEVIELVLSYNLFKGGSDRALARQFAERLAQSQELRDQACRDIRQTLVIAYKDIRNLSRQLTYLDQHRLATEKVREAYRQQFDIGQRTLLDLLDTENEYFQSRRAFSNAQYDHAIAHARTLAGMGMLMQALQVSRDGLPTPRELGQDRFQVDAASQCPTAAPDIALPVEHMALRSTAAQPAAQPATQPATQPPAPRR